MAKRKKKSGAQKPKMTVQEFVSKLLGDKEFRRGVFAFCYMVEFVPGDADAIPKWLNAGARRMGHRFFEKDFVDEFNSQVKSLGFFRRTKIMGTIMGAASAAKKANS